MFKFLLLILLFIIIFPILRLLLAIWKATRRFKKQYGGFTSNGNRYRNEESNSSRTSTIRKKIFSKDDGEYVEFEEIRIEKSTVTDNTEKTYKESQISDAKFEDIKK